MWGWAVSCRLSLAMFPGLNACLCFFVLSEMLTELGFPFQNSILFSARGSQSLQLRLSFRGNIAAVVECFPGMYAVLCSGLSTAQHVHYDTVTHVNTLIHRLTSTHLHRHTHKHIYTDTHIHTHIQTHRHIVTVSCMIYTCTHTYLYTLKQTQIHTVINTLIYSCILSNTYTYTHACAHTNTLYSFLSI